MHDVVAHGLSLIVIQAQGAEAALEHRPDDSRAALRTIVTTGRDSLADMRRVIGALGDTEPSWHPQPGLAQLPALVARVSQAGTPARLHVTGDPAPGDSMALPASVELTAYRVVQEALTNVVKHAGPGATADVTVEHTDAALTLTIRDTGTGSDGGGGHGLPGMRQRVTLLGGWVEAGPHPDGGWVVEVGLPVRGQA